MSDLTLQELVAIEYGEEIEVTEPVDNRPGYQIESERQDYINMLEDADAAKDREIYKLKHEVAQARRHNTSTGGYNRNLSEWDEPIQYPKINVI